MKRQRCLVVVCLMATVWLGGMPTVRAGGMDWTGFYAGLQGGYGFGRHPVALEGSGVIEIAQQDGYVPEEMEIHSSGWLAGLYLGANRQEQAFVFGAEADFSLAGIGGEDVVEADPLDLGNIATTTARQELLWLGTARLRGGVAFAPAMVYGTGGLAFGRYRLSGQVTEGGALIFDDQLEETALGWTAGAGVEIALNKTLRLKAEYLYFHLGEKTLTMDMLFLPLLFPDDYLKMDATVNGHLVRAGLGFAF